jgi:hypothetical protein
MPLDKLLPSPNLNGWQPHYQFWPRDTAIRRNMTTSSWLDVSQLVRSNNLRIVDEDGEAVNTVDAARILKENNKSAVIRFAATVREDRRMTLELQSLPTSLAVVNSKPIFRG